METLFRFTLARPAIRQSEDLPSIELQHRSQLFSDLQQASQQRDPRTELKKVAGQFAGTGGYLAGPASLAIATELKKLDTSFSALEKKPDVKKQDIVDAIEAAFSGQLGSLNANGKLVAAMGMLQDTIVVIKLLPTEHSKPLEEFVRQLRDLDIVMRMVANENLEGTGTDFRRYRRRSLKMPEWLKMPSGLSMRERQQEFEKRYKEEEEERRKSAEAKLDRFKRANAAIKELTALSPQLVSVTPQVADRGALPQANVRRGHVLTQAITENQQLSQLRLVHAQLGVRATETNAPADRRIVARTTFEDTFDARFQDPRLFLAGKGPFIPATPKEAAFVLKPEAERAVSEQRWRF